jgi:hypothetical protein
LLKESSWILLQLASTICQQLDLSIAMTYLTGDISLVSCIC